jgi:hypothetical protein
MFCKVVLVKIVLLASCRRTHNLWYSCFWNGNLLFPEHLWKPLYSDSIHEIIIMLYKSLVKPCMNVEEIIFCMLFHEIVCDGSPSNALSPY